MIFMTSKPQPSEMGRVYERNSIITIRTSTLDTSLRRDNEAHILQYQAHSPHQHITNSMNTNKMKLVATALGLSERD